MVYSNFLDVTQEGIFRRTGSLSRQQDLRQLLLTGSSLGLEEGKFSVHDCASVLKGFLADLPQPLLMDQYYQTYCTLAGMFVTYFFILFIYLDNNNMGGII